MRRSATVLVALALATGLPGAEPDLAPVSRWIDHARSLKALEVEFTQERHLRAVTRPLVSTGRVWFKAPGALRWQVGDPPKLVALQRSRGGEFTVLDMRTHEARVHPGGSLGDRSGSFAFLEASFPASLEEFQKTFRIDRVEPSEDGLIRVTGGVRNRRLDLAVLKVVFVIHPGSQHLRSVEIWFHDGSRIINRFTKVTENPEVPDRFFAESLEGWKVDRG
jgi:outer membrane lipoprotein-sorting protein